MASANVAAAAAELQNDCSEHLAVASAILKLCSASTTTGIEDAATEILVQICGG